VVGWGVLAGGVDALARRLAPGQARGILGPGEGGGRGGRRGRGGRLGRAPRARRGPIDAARGAATRAVLAASRHAAERFLHDAHGPLLPGAPICSSSSRPLLVVSSRSASSRLRSRSSSSLSSLSSLSPSSYSFCLSLGRRRRRRRPRSLNLSLPELESAHVSFRLCVRACVLPFLAFLLLPRVSSPFSPRLRYPLFASRRGPAVGIRGTGRNDRVKVRSVARMAQCAIRLFPEVFSSTRANPRIPSRLSRVARGNSRDIPTMSYRMYSPRFEQMF